jgi:hypothetical protein
VLNFQCFRTIQGRQGFWFPAVQGMENKETRSNERSIAARSAGVTCAAALAVLGSLSALLTWADIYWGIIHADADRQGKRLYDLHPVVFVLLVVVPLFLIVTGLCTGVGLFQLRSWARKLALVWALVALAFCLGMIAFRPFETLFIPENFVSDTESFKQILAVSLIVSALPVSIWWLFFFRMKSVKQQFDANL